MISLSRLQSIIALLTSFLVMSIGHGLLNTLLGIRATQESYSDFTIATLTSSYYVGFIIGTYLAAYWISKVGHIRTFAAFATMASSFALGLVLLVSPTSWTFFRLIYGICIAGLYMVIESWLNGTSKNEERGKILSVYMLISYIGIILGQAILHISSTDGFILFAVCAILLSLSLVPLTVSNSVQPTIPSQSTFKPYRLFGISPLASLGCFASGLILGAFWGFGPVFLLRLGFLPGEAAVFVGATLLGGMVLQWPIGALSDTLGRREMIGMTCLISAVSAMALFVMLDHGLTYLSIPFLMCSILFGGGNYALYSLCIALVNDYLEPKYLLKASGGLLALHAIGAVVGPIVASGFMAHSGTNGFLIFNITVSLFVVVVTAIQMVRGNKIPEETSENFVSVPRTGIGFLPMDPRRKK